MGGNCFALSGIKVLIIDDEPDALMVTRLILTHHYAEVLEASTAAQGLEQLQIHRPDVIVSDIGMPQMDGYQFIREVRNLPAPKGGQTPAVALTAFNRAEDRTRAIEAGFQRHLSKPVEFQTLIDTIVSVIK